MLTTSGIDPQTVQAYQETHYCVDGPNPFVMHIGVPCEPLQKLFRKMQADCASFITACNPYSEDVGESVNAQRQTLLANELKRRSLVYMEGIGKHPSGDWPPEHSFFVVGLSLEAAKALAREHQQNAMVWVGLDCVPQLILLR